MSFIIEDPDDHGDGRCYSFDESSVDGRCAGKATFGKMCKECHNDIVRVLDWMSEL